MTWAPLLLAALIAASVASGAPDVPVSPPPAADGGSAPPAPGGATSGPPPLHVVMPLQHAPENEKGYTFLPVPLISYDSDNGVYFGAAAALFYNDGIAQPYRFSVIGQVLVTTDGVSQDYLKADMLHVLGTDYRINTEVRFLVEPNASFFGIGNTTVNQPQGQPLSYYQYRQVNPAWRVEVRHPLAGHIFLYAGYLIEYAIITVYHDSLLSQTTIPGTGGGLNSPLQAGVVYDSRDFEPWPAHGIYAEVAIRGAQHWTASNYEWVGATGIFRIYQELAFGVIVADRLLIDAMHGTVPFYDEDSTGGIEEMDGLGGFNSMRGFVKDRFMGDGKVLENLELRRFFYGFHLFGQQFDLGAVVFGDAGRVFAHNIDDGPALLIHWDVGGGLRLMLNRDLVIRADVGVSVEGPRVYILFNNMF
jgi:hypothetical protein